MSVRKPTLTQGTGNNARVTGHSEAARSWRVPPNTLFSTDGTPRGEALRRLSPSGCVGCCAMRSRPDSQSCHGSHCCHNGAHCAPSRSASHHLCTPSSDTSASSCDDSSCAACWSGAHGGEVSRSSGASIRGIGLTFRGLGAGKVCRLSGVSLRSTMCCEGHRFDVVSLGRIIILLTRP